MREIIHFQVGKCGNQILIYYYLIIILRFHFYWLIKNKLNLKRKQKQIFKH